MAITQAKKSVIVKNLSDKFSRAKSIAWSKYMGLDVKNLTEFRKAMREKGIDFTIAKKTLIKRAAASAGIKEIPAELEEGAVGVAFGYEDELAPAKAVFVFGKTHEQVGLLGAWIDGKFYSKSEATELAKIPGKQELYAKFLYLCNAPMSGFVGVGNALLRNFVYALSEISKKDAGARSA